MGDRPLIGRDDHDPPVAIVSRSGPGRAATRAWLGSCYRGVTMSNLWRVSAAVGPLLLALLLTGPACSSTRVAADAGSGTGGAGGVYGDAAIDAAANDAGSTAAQSNCGDASCTIGETYCRVLSAPGGQTGSNGPSWITNYDCPALNSGCTAHDCSCVTVHQGFYDCSSCSQLDSGAIVASCSKV